MPQRLAVSGNRHRRRPSGGAGARRSGPSTPLLSWSLEDLVSLPPDGISKPEKKLANNRATSGDAANGGELTTDLSVRRLAAAVWRLQPPEFVAAGGGGGGGGGLGRCSMVDSEAIPRHLHVQLLKPTNQSFNHISKTEISSPNSVLNPTYCDFNKIDSAEKATKWDPESAHSSAEGAYKLATQLNLTEKPNETSIVLDLQLELEQACAKITKLETEKHNAKKKIDSFLNKISEDKAAWRKREHEKVRAVMDDMKAELEKEKKNRRRLEVLNSKLLSEAKENRLSSKQLIQDYEKERNNRELIEEVCDELAKEVEEDKIEIETLKQECFRIREEVDEERKMLQMAEVWREERVQMKLVDAKITLENKFSELDKLQKELERFLIEAQNCNNGEVEVVKKADDLLRAVNSVTRDKEIDGLIYEPPRDPEDIITIFEELKGIESCCKNSPGKDPESEIQVASPDTDIFLENPKKLFESGISNDSETEEVTSWETISRTEEGLDSSNSNGGSELSVNNQKLHEEIQNAVSGINEINQMYSPDNKKQPRKKESAISRLLWKPTRQKNREIEEVLDPRLSNARISNARTSVGNYSPEVGLHEIGLSPSQSLGDHWSSPDSMNLQYPRGFRGCIECPRGMQQKHSLKAKLMEARMESQKVQLRHVLKQKI
ncbi:hypothetical protein FCM35_KLT08751 [Carex littledalei]|uniref:Uncharacterized protein n=1 Tax=Carex littledalei TaxID=544730 RepID=A0A833QVD2_9POAL|nr:hypothetical protein FCM35_KLT08751 [Carex littledalei]